MALNISRGVVQKAQKVCVYGPEGIGKSTFASQFPDPLFIDTEGSTNHMDVARLPRPSSWTMLLSNITDVKNSPGCCKTLIIDTVDWAEQLCVNHVCTTHNKKGVEEFGWGKGYVFVKEEIGRFLNLLSDVVEAGIHVVLTAHAQVRKFELPDECGSYDRYELKLGNKTSGNTAALVKEWADMVLFANYKQYVVEVNEKKKAQGGARVIFTQHHPCWDAKNRCGLKPELPFDYEQIASCFTTEPPQAPVAAKKQETKPAAPAKEQVHEPVKAQETQPAAPTAKAEPATVAETKLQKEPPNGIPKPLADLMAKNDVKVDEIQKVVACRGYYPHDTPIDKYDAGFIDGVLVGAWDQVFAMVKEARELPY